MKVVALLTGRGNNTLKDKNVLDILGHPVLYYPAHATRQVDIIDGFFVVAMMKKYFLQQKKRDINELFVQLNWHLLQHSM